MFPNVFLFLLFALYSFLFAVDVKTPEDPKPPVLVDPSSKETTDLFPSEKKDPPAKGKKRIRLNLKLCDGREVSGTFEYEKNDISIKHVKDGIHYEKKIKISEIKKIYIQSWEGKKDKKVKEGYTYRFDPLETNVLTRDGDQFKVRGPQFSEFQKINLQNSNGTTVLYTFWIDLKYENGSWYTGLPPIKGNEREDCHPDSIRNFLLYPDE
jgi:hypothetical protein